MEFLLLWWDELDDYVHACRHLAAAAVEEVVALAPALSLGASAIGAGLLVRALVHAGAFTSFTGLLPL
jgi:hypothetical protein